MLVEKEVIAIQDCQDGRYIKIEIGKATVEENGEIVFQLPYPFPRNFIFKIVDAKSDQKVMP